MSKAAIDQAINAIADDLLALAHLVLDDDTVSNNTKINKNTLKNSALNGDLYATIGQSFGSDPVITALFNHYVVYLEWDRPPGYGKPPPISALKDWAAAKGISTDADVLYAIAYAIWRDGHDGRPIFATMDKEVDGLFEKDWAPQLFAALTDQLDKFFS
jgi:hypothetical protein